MFRIYANGNLIDSHRVYGSTIEKVKKIKELFFKNTSVIIEDKKGNILERL